MLKIMVEILNLPLAILNVGSGVVGGIWLAVLGEWYLIAIGLILLVTGKWIISILLMLSIPLAGVTHHFQDRNKLLFFFFGFLAQFYTNSLIIGTCLLAFVICTSPIRVDISAQWVPYLLWSWGMALGVWQFFLSKEPDNESSAITLFCTSILYLLFLVSIFVGPTFTLTIMVIAVVALLIILPVFNLYVARRL